MMSKLTKEQAVIISGYTMVLCCRFSDLHEEIEKRLGHPVWTHQLGDKEFVDGKVKPAFKEDFLSLMPDIPNPNEESENE